MQTKKYQSEYFNAADTLGCGQVFRYEKRGEGYILYSGSNACLVETRGGDTFVTSDDADYFENYFDISRDYSAIVSRAQAAGNAFLGQAARSGKGIRILKQNAEEALFSFIISQNNNIPRIKGIISRLCEALGEEQNFGGENYRAFPKAAFIAQKPAVFYYGLGLGYRADYLPAVADALTHGFDLCEAAKLKTPELKKELLKLKGVGPKVADCVLLFGFARTDSFPVDVWMEKIYREDFGGDIPSRTAISEWFVTRFGNDAGFFQQYMFHNKRNNSR